MKIAFPTLDDNGENSKMGNHFGRVPFYTVFVKEDNSFSSFPNVGDHFGGSQSTPEMVKENDIDILICKALGRKAVGLFNQLKIQVYITDKLTVKETLDAFNNNELTMVTDETACSGKHK